MPLSDQSNSADARALALAMEWFTDEQLRVIDRWMSGADQLDHALVAEAAAREIARRAAR